MDDTTYNKGQWLDNNESQNKDEVREIIDILEWVKQTTILHWRDNYKLIYWGSLLKWLMKGEVVPGKVLRIRWGRINK